VTDQIKDGKVKVTYCPTENILEDFFIKSLQGATFWKMREHILNLPSANKGAKCTRVCWERQKNEGC